ncbi:hypothetical protein BIV57_05785 [Mangrovactinospora gilvigrisea]|uniref:peptidylprolyl isomerase n=1 Tax=Mangrovactinospora gilvigrisea TaxID=1428644 RepID=A0A1J7BIJ2_9ACTN|nr:FKBP-type peptidyl-prolyl cis-trans isomerase [Mangrovactinospora gilvigrisea]OIV38405.1 hypothetical protein BIV57_05785 [Mangrovactinospora gilvigrisea]
MTLTKNVRRGAVALAVPALLVGVAACGSGSSKSSSDASKPNGAVAAVSGAFGQAPKVTSDAKKKAATNQVVKTVKQGSGATLADGDNIRVSGMALKYGDGKALISTYSPKNPKLQAVTQIGASQASGPFYSDAAVKALAGQKAGSRVLVQDTAKDLFPQQYQQVGLKATDVIDYVFDVYASDKTPATDEVKGTQAAPSAGMATAKVPSQAAKLVQDPTTGMKADPKKIASFTIPKTPKSLSGLKTQVLIQGKGAAVQKGQALVTQYTGTTWDTNKVFDSSWKHGGATAFQIGTGAVIKGWDNALVGQKVGSRVLVEIPKKDAYGAKTSAQNAAAGHDLVFVVDIVAAF